MALGNLRYYREFTSTVAGGTGDTWKLEIYDSDYVASASVFRGGGADALVFDYSDEGSNYSPILASKASFTFIIEDGNTNLLVRNITETEEGRFKLKVLKNGAFYWGGSIISEGIVTEDISYPRTVTITATDELARLKEIEYKNTSGPYSGEENLLNHILNALGKNTSLDIWGASDDFLETVIDWNESGHTRAVGSCPLALTRVNHSAFYEKEKQNVYIYYSAYDVLKSILLPFGAFIMQAEGKYLIRQITEQGESSFYAKRIFDKSGNLNSSAAAPSYDATLNQTTLARLAGGTWNYVRPLKKVEVVYKHKSGDNFAPGSNWDNSNTPNAVSLGQINVSGTTQFKCTFDFEIETTHTTPADIKRHKYYFFIRLKVGSNYLRKSYLPGQTNIIWDNSIQYYEHEIPVQVEGYESRQTVRVSFTTPSIPATGAGELAILLNRVEDATGTVLTSPYTFTWSVNDPYIELLYGNAENSKEVYYTAEFSNDNTGTESFDSLIGDAINASTPSRLETRATPATSTWATSTDWERGATTPALPILQLLAREFLAVKKVPSARYSGTFYGKLYPYQRFVFDGGTYIFIRGTYTAGTYQDLNGEFLKVGRDATGTTTGEIPLFPDRVLQPHTPTPVNPDDVDTLNVIAETGRAIGSTSTTTGTAESATTIDINPLGYTVNSGSVIRILDPTTGLYEDVTVSTNIGASDTSITISGGTTNAYSTNSVLFSNPTANPPATTGENVGTGAGEVFKEKDGDTLKYKTIKAGTNITVTNNADDIEIAATSSGEANTASNVGTGGGQIFKQKNGVDLELKTLTAGTGISIATGANEITITNTGTGLTGSGTTGKIPKFTGSTALGDSTIIEGANYVNVGRSQLSINGAPATTGSALLINSTTGTLVVPRMTTTQRDAISSVNNGSIIYNSTLNEFQFYIDGAWQMRGLSGSKGELYVSSAGSEAFSSTGSWTLFDGYTTTAGALKNFTHSNEKLTYTGAGEDFKLAFSFVYSGDVATVEFDIALYKNGSIISKSQTLIETSDIYKWCGITQCIETSVATNDYFELYAKKNNGSGTHTLTIHKGNFIITPV